MTEINQNFPKVYPWRRFFARRFDFFIKLAICLLIDVILLIIGIPSKNLWGIISIIGLLTINPILMTLTGSTLGKYLFGVKIRDRNNEKLALGLALRREFLVYMKGMAFCIPIASIFALCFSKSRLRKKGKTSWDEKLKCNVTYAENSIKQRILGITGFFLLALLVLAFVWLCNLGLQAPKNLLYPLPIQTKKVLNENNL